MGWERYSVTDDVTKRVLRLFERRLKSEPEVSAATAKILLMGQRTNDFGNDDEILTDLVEAFEKDQ